MKNENLQKEKKEKNDEWPYRLIEKFQQQKTGT